MHSLKTTSPMFRVELRCPCIRYILPSSLTALSILDHVQDALDMNVDYWNGTSIKYVDVHVFCMYTLRWIVRRKFDFPVASMLIWVADFAQHAYVTMRNT